MTLLAGTHLGPYEILAPLGAGGMGEVYRARDSRLGREVAVKILPGEVATDPGRRERFEQEARSASALNHPNILTIHDIGEADGSLYIAMELVEGKTVRELIGEEPLPARRLLHLAVQIADGLAKAHAAGIVHRDLKPENLMVSRDGFVKILDFGLAKLTEPVSQHVSALPTAVAPPTQPGTVMGTAGYMSPEQASGRPVDFRSDQFALGSILYEMASGRRAFQRKTVAETLTAIIREEPEPLAQAAPTVPAPLRWIIERCLAKEPEERYASTRDLARDLAGMRDRISEVSGGAEALLVATKRPRRRLLMLMLGLAVLSVAVLAGWLGRGFLSAPPAAPRFTRLTFRHGDVGNARFAPDGQTIVYGAKWAGDPPGKQLYRTQIGSPESARFDFAGDILAISPSNELAIQLPSGTLARVPMSGGTPRQVLEHVDYQGADFSPDGKELAVAHFAEGQSRIEFPIGNVLVPRGAAGPRVSRDGRSVAFWDDTEGASALAVIDRHGGPKRVLSRGWTDPGPPCWSASGREIWFAAQEPGKPTAVWAGESPHALWAVDVSGKRRLVMRVPGSLELDDVSRDGRALLGHFTYEQTVRFASASDPGERELSWLDASVIGDLSSDGKTLLLNEVGEGSGSDSVIYLRGTDGMPAVKLGEGTGFALSPDGSWVIAVSAPGNGKTASLSLVPTGPGQPHALAAEGLTAYGWGAWLPDGKRVVYSAVAKQGDSRLYVQAVPDGKPQAIGPENVRILPGTNPVSPDGKYAVGIRRGGETLLISLDGTGQARVLPGLSPVDRVVQWSHDSRGLYVYGQAERPLRVWLLDVETGKRRLWKEIPIDSSIARIQLRISLDGKMWTYGGVRILSELYLVEGLR